MARRGSMFRLALIAVLLVAGGGLLLFAQDNAAVSELPECVVPATTTPPESTSTPAAQEPLRLHMPDGQLISHGLTVYVTTSLTASQKPRLRMFRSHAVTQAGADEDTLLTPVLVVPNQQWTETYLGRQVTPTGTILIFDTSAMSFFPKAMVRVRPLLLWDGGGCVLGPRDINVGDIRYAMAWTVGVIVIGIGLVLLLAGAEQNPMLLLTGVDGHLALSQTQIACWTIVVGSVVVGYGLIQREIPEIPASLIALMGASLATGGIAYFQDAKKATAAAHATGTRPAALNWAWGDLVRIFPLDGPPELSLSKAQMLFWTVLLLVLFLSKSILEGGIWEVPWPLVALMGFSQVGYLAPKVADNATTPANP